MAFLRSGFRLILGLVAASTQTIAAATLPDAGPSPADGTQSVVIHSTALSRDRKVLVSLPPSYARTRRTYPVVVVLDGEADFEDAVTVTRKLADLGHVPECIVAAIPNSTSDPDDRVYDMTPPGMSVSGSSRSQGGEQFLDFLEKEVLPLVAQRFRGGRPAILVGHSSGALIATYAATTRPAAFPIVIAIDGPIQLDDDWVAKRLIARARSAGTPLLRYVSLEARFGWPDRTWSELVSAAPASWLLERRHLDGESHETMVFLALYEGLKSAFRDYSIVGAKIPPRGSALGAFDHYRHIEEQLGTKLPPPAPVLDRLVEDLLTEGRVEPARRALDWLVEGYGAPPDVAELQKMIQHAATLPPLTETVESLKAAPWPAAAEIASYAGDWDGEETIGPEFRSRMALRIRIVDGATRAERVFFADGEEHVEPVEYLKVLTDGLEFGVMNGMRPMGMIVHSGRRTGDALEGEGQFRGIVLPLPTGHMPPVSHFRLVKQPAAK